MSFTSIPTQYIQNNYYDIPGMCLISNNFVHLVLHYSHYISADNKLEQLELFDGTIYVDEDDKQINFLFYQF